MDGTTRHLTRRLLINNHVAARIQTELGEDINQAERDMMTSLRQYSATDVLVGQQWEYAGHFKFEDNIAVRMAHYAVIRQDALDNLEKAVNSGEGRRFAQTYLKVTNGLATTIETIDDQCEKNGLIYWQIMDIGHCFRRFYSDLSDALKLPDSKTEFEVKDKSGLKALILEDDDSQRFNQVDLVNRHSVFETDDTLCFATPEGIETQIMNPQIGIFLIDVQNGLDATAGIRVAKDVLIQRLTNKEMMELPKTKIVVWSSSAKAIHDTSDYFETVIGHLPEDQQSYLGYSVNGLHKYPLGEYRSDRVVVRLDIRNKDLNYYNSEVERHVNFGIVSLF